MINGFECKALSSERFLFILFNRTMNKDDGSMNYFQKGKAKK